MKQQEKDTLLQFMGQVYGETKKHDQMVVGQSTNLQPKSEEVKREFEKVLKTTPIQHSHQPHQALPAQEPAQTLPVQNNVVTPEQAAAELAQAQQKQIIVSEPTQANVEQFNDPNQMEFNLTEPSKVDKIIELLESQNKLLVEIRDSSIKSKYNAKRAKDNKSQ